ncbi:hypothetical protein KAI32_03595 [Candidatus Pacearchaeota archaeon]|nr:hypothetical protein [Candidatus Pacearchaeota archaeon]
MEIGNGSSHIMSFNSDTLGNIKDNYNTPKGLGNGEEYSKSIVEKQETYNSFKGNNVQSSIKYSRSKRSSRRNGKIGNELKNTYNNLFSLKNELYLTQSRGKNLDESF